MLNKAEYIEEISNYDREMLKEYQETKEAIVFLKEQLEKEEENSLEESMKLFEEGVAISKKCNQEIEKAEQKISILIEENDEIKEENFIQKTGNEA